MLYGNNHFSFYDFSGLKTFLETIGSMRQHLRFIHTENEVYRRRHSCLVGSLGDAVGLRSFSIDHRLACHPPEGAYYRWNHTLSGFVSTMSPVMRALKENAEGGEEGILDIITVTFTRCSACEKTAPDFPATDSACSNHGGFGGFSSHRCKVVCKKLQQHCDKIQADIRKRIATQLQIVDTAERIVEEDEEQEKEKGDDEGSEAGWSDSLA